MVFLRLLDAIRTACPTGVVPIRAKTERRVANSTRFGSNHTGPVAAVNTERPGVGIPTL